MKYFIWLILGLLLVTCTVKKQPVNSSCDTENLGIDTTYRHTPMAYAHPNGTPYFSNDTWKWFTTHDTIVVWGGLDSGGEDGLTRYMFFKKNCDCIELINAIEVQCSDVVELDENGNYINNPCGTYDVYHAELVKQAYVEDSLLVGKVGGVSFWMEFSPRYWQVGSW